MREYVLSWVALPSEWVYVLGSVHTLVSRLFPRELVTYVQSPPPATVQLGGAT